jgi:hypothetical protein
MAVVEIDTNSDEFQAWYLAVTSFPPSALLESQAKLNEILGRHFEDTNLTGWKKQGQLYAAEQWRNIKVNLQKSCGVSRGWLDPGSKDGSGQNSAKACTPG